ncbi:hypothetical protein ABTH15_19345, partial [Acinetobacter baumannii]
QAKSQKKGKQRVRHASSTAESASSILSYGDLTAFVDACFDFVLHVMDNEETPEQQKVGTSQRSFWTR